MGYWGDRFKVENNRNILGHNIALKIVDLFYYILPFNLKLYYKVLSEARGE